MSMLDHELMSSMYSPSDGATFSGNRLDVSSSSGLAAEVVFEENCFRHAISCRIPDIRRDVSLVATLPPAR